MSVEEKRAERARLLLGEARARVVQAKGAPVTVARVGYLVEKIDPTHPAWGDRVAETDHEGKPRVAWLIVRTTEAWPAGQCDGRHYWSEADVRDGVQANLRADRAAATRLGIRAESVERT